MTLFDVIPNIVPHEKLAESLYAQKVGSSSADFRNKEAKKN